MKNIFYILLIIFVISCVPHNANEVNTISNYKSDTNYSVNGSSLKIKGIVTIEGCEYFIIKDDWDIMVHKGNCKNPIHKCNSCK